MAWDRKRFKPHTCSKAAGYKLVHGAERIRGRTLVVRPRTVVWVMMISRCMVSQCVRARPQRRRLRARHHHKLSSCMMQGPRGRYGQRCNVAAVVCGGGGGGGVCRCHCCAVRAEHGMELLHDDIHIHVRVVGASMLLWLCGMAHPGGS